MAKREGFAELGEDSRGRRTRGLSQCQWMCSSFPVLQGGWRTSLLVQREGDSKIGRKRDQRAGEVREKGHQPQGEITARRGLQRRDKGTRSSRALW